MKRVKVFNGRWTWGSRSMSGYIGAYSKRHACELAEIAGYQLTLHELNVYWAACWGTQMQKLVPEPEPGVWITEDHRSSTPIIRLIDADGKLMRHMDTFSRSRP